MYGIPKSSFILSTYCALNTQNLNILFARYDKRIQDFVLLKIAILNYLNKIPSWNNAPHRDLGNKNIGKQ